MRKIKSNDEALKLFEESSIRQSDATETGDYKTGNRHHDIIVACILYLYDNQQLQLLEPFLEHQHVGVRLWAAFALLSVDKIKAERVLKEVQNDDSNGIYRSDAMYTLKEWKNGKLKFPWEWARKK